MTEQKRVRLGVAAAVAGVVLFAVGVAVAHFSGLSAHNSLGQEIYPHIPRCAWFESDPSKCWVIPTAGQIVALVGSQLFLGGILLAWVVGRPLTWARATLAALFTTLEMLILFGMVPNQWLALTQGTWEWTGQRIAFTLPKWLMLNNEVSISYGVIKDIVSGGYSATLLGAVAVGAYQLQERSKRPPAAKPQKISSFGRPIVEGDR